MSDETIPPVEPEFPPVEPTRFRKSKALPGLLAVPCLPWMYSAAAESILWLSHALPRGSDFLFGHRLTSSLAAKRNGFAEALLDDTRFEWLLFVDSDMHVPIDAFERLYAHNVDIVSGSCVRRSDPYDPTHEGARPSTTHPGLLEVKWAGAACLLIRRHVFLKVSKPWFAHPREHGDGVGEDVFFCERARRHGFKIYVDPAVEVGHMTTLPVTPASGKRWREEREERAPGFGPQRRAEDETPRRGAA